MSTSFFVISDSEEAPTVQSLMDRIKRLPQFDRTGICLDEIKVKIVDQTEPLPPEQYASVTLNRCYCFIMKDECLDGSEGRTIFFIRNCGQEEYEYLYDFHELSGIKTRWTIEARANYYEPRSLYVAIPCALALLTDGTVCSGDSAWYDDNDYRGDVMWDEFVRTELPYWVPKKPFFCPVLNTELKVSRWELKVSESYMLRCKDVLLNMPDALLNALCEAAKRFCLRPECTGRPESLTADTPAKEFLQQMHFISLELSEPEDETQTGFGLAGKCAFNGDDIGAVILDGRLLWFGFDEMSPWMVDEWIQYAGDDNYA